MPRKLHPFFHLVWVISQCLAKPTRCPAGARSAHRLRGDTRLIGDPLRSRGRSWQCWEHTKHRARTRCGWLYALQQTTTTRQPHGHRVVECIGMYCIDGRTISRDRTGEETACPVSRGLPCRTPPVGALRRVACRYGEARMLPPTAVPVVR